MGVLAMGYRVPGMEMGDGGRSMYSTGHHIASCTLFRPQAIPTIPPMVRAPWTNQVPDFVLVSNQTLATGYGG